MRQKNFNELRKQVRELLFEYSEYSDSSWADGERAGTQFPDEVEEDDPLEDLPVSIDPEMAVQLSTQQPPVDDPDFEPSNPKELARALSVLAQRLPDDTVKKTYDKFSKYVDDNEVEVIEVVDEAGEDEAVDEIEEARAMIRNQLVTQLLEGNWDEFKLGHHYDDDGDEDDWGEPTDDELEAVQSGDPRAGEVTLAQIAKEMGLSTSGVKKIEAQALDHFRLIYHDFPGDIGKIRSFALDFFANALLELDAIDEIDAQELRSAPDAALGWAPLRYFMWDGFLNNVYNKMVRDAKRAGLDPKTQLSELTPGLYSRAKMYFDGLPHTKLMKSVVDAMNAI